MIIIKELIYAWLIKKAHYNMYSQRRMKIRTDYYGGRVVSAQLLTYMLIFRYFSENICAMRV